MGTFATEAASEARVPCGVVGVPSPGAMGKLGLQKVFSPWGLSQWVMVGGRGRVGRRQKDDDLDPSVLGFYSVLPSQVNTSETLKQILNCGTSPCLCTLGVGKAG